jgi:hypothetical protein
MLVDATRFRVNDAQTSAIFLSEGGRSRMLILDKSSNEYREMDQQTVDQLGKQVQGMMAQMEAQMKNMPPEQRAMMEQMMKGKMPQQAAPVRTVYTAKGPATVNGFKCTNHDGTRDGQKVAEVCTAPGADLKLSAADLQVFEKMRAFSAELQKAVQSMPIAAGFSSISDQGLDGFPVQQTSFVNGKATEKVELKSLTEANLTDADFSVGNAKKVDMPAMPQGGGKQR